MKDKYIDISESGASLSVKHDQLIIRHVSGENSVPIDELAALVISHPASHLSHAVLSQICSAGGTIVICNEKRLPTGILFPLVGHTQQSERMAAQAEASAPLKKNIWKQLISAKIRGQGKLLIHRNNEDYGLIRMAGKVLSGDPDNKEAQASRKYWSLLFELISKGVEIGKKVA